MSIYIIVEYWITQTHTHTRNSKCFAAKCSRDGSAGVSGRKGNQANREWVAKEQRPTSSFPLCRVKILIKWVHSAYLLAEMTTTVLMLVMKIYVSSVSRIPELKWWCGEVRHRERKLNCCVFFIILLLLRCFVSYIQRVSHNECMPFLFEAIWMPFLMLLLLVVGASRNGEKKCDCTRFDAHLLVHLFP